MGGGTAQVGGAARYLEEALDPDQRDHLNAEQRLTVAKLGIPSAANRDDPWLNYDIVNLIGSFVRDGYGYGYGPQLYGPRYGARLAEDDPERGRRTLRLLRWLDTEVARYGPRLYGSRYGPRHGPHVVVTEAEDDSGRWHGARLYGSRYGQRGTPHLVVEEAEDDPEEQAAALRIFQVG